ncbi:hypothetical protein QUW50_08280 [Barnesiella viscericola]|jgi:hypothetical protein|uniref:hypothetical protein n=1 Tax=Barnesiella viscericola TaxID=397865 RepID=UPI000335DA64|nr:hypothetical protein [Barnesiella viscericola]MDM8269034.1 hypothetical protein [Barnesiella viscericola]CCZ13766.1 putative uncharacterized protein [Prevotella sp. CAG:487]
MYRLTAKITIDGGRRWQLEEVTAVEITRDTEKLTDECRITLPKKVKWDGEPDIPVRRGDMVSVSLGYDGELQAAFSGYVRDVGFKTPIVLVCEDEMFKLKQQPAQKKAYRNVDLETLLKDQGIGCEIRVFGEQRLGQYRVTADTVASLLGKLQQQGIRSFFRTEDGQPVLYCGVLFERETSPSQVFATGLNIIDDQSLEQQQADTMRLRVKAVSLMPDNKKVKVEVGDADGELRVLHTYNKTESELKAWAEQEVKRLKRDGLTGSFKTFGYRLVDKLDVIGMKIDGEKKGCYQVKKNVIKYDTGGFRQEITLGYRVAE